MLKDVTKLTRGMLAKAYQPFYLFFSEFDMALFHRQVVFICILFCGQIWIGSSQPTLKIQSSQVQSGQLRIEFNVLCNELKQFELQKIDFSLKENGTPITNFTVYCPDSNQHCCKTIGLVSVMRFAFPPDTDDTHFKKGLRAFVERMNACDEAAYIRYGGPVRVKVPVTHDTLALKKAIDEIDGGTPDDVEGAIIKAIQEAEKGSNNPCKAIVLYTPTISGVGNTFTMQQVVDTALAHGYKIYCVIPESGPIGYTDFKYASQATGGRYLGSTDTTLTRLVRDMRLIYDIIDNQFKYCTLAYDIACKDGTQRNVDITVNKCGGTDRKTITYTAPYDPTSFISVALRLSTTTVTGGQRATIDLDIGPPVDAFFQTCTFRIRYDPSCCTFIGLDESNGFLKGIPLNVQTSSGLIEVTTQKSFQLFGSGLLASLTFQSSDPEQDTDCPITLESWTFNNGCLNPKLFNGKIIINARKPILDCAIELPDSLAWNRILNNYDPNPFTAFVTITNSGNREARNVKAKITLPSDNSLILAGPTVDTQPATPSLMKINSLSTAAWGINAKERMSSDSLQVCIEVWADNHPTIQCCKKIYIPVVGARLTCGLSVEKIKVDTKLNRYTPMPFTIIDTVKNTGGLPTDTVFTTIILPQGLTLANVPNNSQIKRAQPIKLLPQSKGTASWQFYHPITIEEKKYTITICNRTGYPSLREKNADSVCCDVDIVIPQIDAPVLECTVTAVDSLFYDEAKDEYNPNPFPFTVAVKNTGSLDADSVRATIVLPSEFVLEPPTQPTTKYFNPMLVVKYTPTLPPNEVTWMVQALDQKKRKASEIKVKLNGVMR